MTCRPAPRIATLCLCAGLSLAFFGAGGDARAQVPESEEGKTLYALGLAVAKNLKAFDLSPAEVKIVVAGLEASLAGEKPALEVDAYREKLNALAQARVAARATKEREASAKFLADAAGRQDAQKKASGLIYREVRAGSGDAPTAKDKVRVEYSGRRRDGSVFDSSAQHGKPADFPLARMIPCWIEGIQLMKPGGKAVLTCPADLAYGDTGIPPGVGDMIAPGAALEFDIELLGVEKGAGEAPAEPPTP